VKLRKRYIIGLFLFWLCSSLQAHNRVDSLLRLLPSVELSEQEHISLLLQLSAEYGKVDVTKAMVYAMEASHLAGAANLSSLEAKAYHLLGSNEVSRNQYDSAIYYYQLAIPLFDPELDKLELAHTLNERGISYENKGNYTEAYKDYLNSLKIYEAIGDNKGIANEYENIGLIHYYKKEFGKADTYFKDALNISQSIMYKEGIAAAFNNLGINQLEQGNAKLALVYFKKVLEMDVKTGDPSNIAYSLNNVGSVYADLNNHQEALAYFQRSALLKYEVKDYIGLSNTFSNIGSSLTHLAEYGLAKHYLDSSLLLSENYGFRNNIVEIYKTFYELEFAQKNYAKALFYYKEYEAQKDSIERSENILAIGKLQAMHELEKANLELDDKKEDLRVANLAKFISIFAVLLMILLCFYFYYNNIRIHKLNKLLNKQRDELIASKEEAENASKVKSQFLSVVSHEIRTPLNAIIGVSNLLHEGNASPQHSENVNVLRSSSQHLLKLINDLLDLNKLEVGKMLADIEQLNIRKIAESVVKMFTVLASQKGIELQYHIDPRIQSNLLGDDVKLTQTLTNLIGNAVKFTDSGFVRLNIVQLKSDPQSSRIRFSVEDTGIGIEEVDQQNIFDTFIQSNHITKKYGGTGLGLSISKKLIEVMGGKIQLVSKMGQGSIFSFELDFFSEAKLSPAIAPGHVGSKKFFGKRILIAEDNPVNVFVLNQFLHKWDIETQVAVNGAEVINKLTQQSFDLVLMDVHMPVKDGIEATREIRLMEARWRNIPIIAITASHEYQVKEEVIRSGMNDYIIKPFVPEDLFDKLSKYI
jgi:signal transduction histidine kinase/BarA-like signal transduction histidine kinase